MRVHVAGRRWSVAAALAVFLGIMLFVAAAAAARPVPTGAVSGSAVTPTGKPVAGVTVIPYVYTYAGADWWVWEQVPNVTAVTGRNGSYTMKLPAGTYRLLFVPKDQDLKTYAIEAYPNAPAPDFGDDVIVKYGKTTTRISAILDPSACMRGAVRDAATGNGVGGIRLQVIFQGTARINMLPSAWADSGADGYYEVWGLKPYPGFTLNVSDTRAPEQWWGPWYQSQADFPLVTDMGDPLYGRYVRDSDVMVESVELPKLTGFVHDGDGNAIAGISVNVYGDGIETVTTQTDASGAFTFNAGQLRLGPEEFWITEWVAVELVDPIGTYYDMYYNGWPDADGAEPVTAELGKTTALDVRMWKIGVETPPWEW